MIYTKIQQQLGFALDNYKINSQVEHYKGKVRNNFIFDDEIVMITSDRVSAFDHVLGTIPFKGQILTDIASFWFNKTKDVVPNHLISQVDPQVLLVKKAKTLPVEVIVRGYITGSLWREYTSGINGQYGFMLPENLKENQKFDKPILTPSTKADYGLHDEPISRHKIVNDLVEESIYSKAEEYALKLFKMGQDWADKNGLILVDTKYEFGIVDDELIVIDEIHTPDSSRYWIKDEYQSRYENNQKQKMLDKENIRHWLMDRGFSGEGSPPPLSDEIRISLAKSYFDLYQKLTGKEFNPDVGDVLSRLKNNLKDYKIFK
ncbi:MAG: phosphoribosylaminoimidazolesuccinocarboxamide synthase [Candidatus Marinimicrobia bacterium]|nr:phosphoribosylaminoimidazolesuccinocarboxamide synthase [Candidatus Neomarinimicrobiota bacterium]